MPQYAIAETNIEKYMPIKKKGNLLYFILINRFFPLVYLSVNDSLKSISEMTTIIVEYGILGEKYFDIGYQI